MKSTRRAARTAGSHEEAADKNNRTPTDDLKPGKFYLEAPHAQSVQLAAGFTEWEKSPLDLIKSDDGTWLLVLPLPPGEHHYRFIVDGNWCDDPHATRYAPNPFGTRNSLKIIT